MYTTKRGQGWRSGALGVFPALERRLKHHVACDGVRRSKKALIGVLWEASQAECLSTKKKEEEVD